MYDWLEKEENRNINRSDLFRKAVDKLRYKQDEEEKQHVSPLMFLVSVMGIVFSISLIGIAVTPSPIHIFARGLLTLLGGFLALLTSVTYYKVRNTSLILGTETD